MDPLTRVLIRMSMLLRRPPSRQRLLVMAAVFVLAGLFVGIERLFGWPEALTTERVPIRRM